MSDQAIEQSQELSIEDRMAAFLAQEEQPAEQEEQEEAEPESTQEEAEETEQEETEETEQAEGEEETEESGLVEVEVDGETYLVPEALKAKLSEGMMQADYTRKTQELAEQRKQVETMQMQIQSQAQAQQAFINEYAQLVSLDNMIQQYSNVDWNQLYESDPSEFVRMKEAVRDLKDSRVSLANQLSEKQQQQMQQQNEVRIQAIRQGQEILAKEIPEWNTNLAKTLNDFAVSKYGFTADEVASVIDPRVVKLLYDAHKGTSQREKANVISKKVANLPKVAKPGSPKNTENLKQSRVKESMKALKKSGRVEDAAQAFLARM